MPVKDWSSTATANTEVGGLSTDGNTQTVNNIDGMFRGMMADIRTGINAGSFTGAASVTKTANYTALLADWGTLFHFTSAATLSLTAAATLTSGWAILVRARGGAVTVDPNGAELINGVATLVIPDGNSALIVCTGTAFLTAYDTAEISTFMRTVNDDTTAAAARTTLGAANSSGQVFTGLVESPDNLYVRAPRLSAVPGATNTGGIVTSWIGQNVSALSAQFFASEIVGTAVRAGIAATAGGSTAYLLFTNTGNLAVPGALSKGSGTFLTDHPLDPMNKDLAHGFVESPRYELIYRGRAKLIAGRAWVDIDAASNMTSGTFAALTTNAEVTSLQNQDGFARLRPTAISGGTFEIICEDSTCTDEVAWVVIAERNDAFVRVMDDNCDDDGRFIPERDKEDA